MKPYAIAIIVIGLILIIAVILVFSIRRFSRTKIQWLVNRSLYKLAKAEDFYLLNNLALDLAEDTSIHIDHLLCGDKFIYLISDRFLGDGIEGSPEDHTIFSYQRNQRIEIQNPIYLNELRTLKLAKYLNWTEDKTPIILSIIVTNNKLKIVDKLKLNGPDSFVVERKNLNKLIEKIESESPAGTFDLTNLEKMVEHLNHLSNQHNKVPTSGIR